MADLKFQGAFTALVTPFVAGGDSIDFEALGKLAEAQIAGGVTGLVPCGTTGETPTLSDGEQLEVIRKVVAVAAGRVPVVAGTGSNSTRKSIKASQAAIEAGVDGVMIVMPYYNKPSQAGMREHVVTIAKEVSETPIIVYNIPGRSVVDLSADATVEICEQAANVVAIKDATGNVLRCQEVKRRLGDRLTVMSGDDGLTLGMMAVGASGVISVSSNVIPAEVSAVTSAMLSGDHDAARNKHYGLLEFHRLMFVEPNPGPAKAALAQLGAMNSDVRLPLLPANETTHKHIAEALKALGKL